MEIKYLKSAAGFPDRDYVNIKVLDLSNEVLWVSIGQRAAELPFIKVGGLKKILLLSPVWASQVLTEPNSRIFF